MSKNNSGPGNPKKGKSLAPNPASVDLFETEDVLASTQAFKNFIASLDRKFHIKNPTTFSKAKLPLLYKQVKDAVTLKMKKELPGTGGIAFTSDMWSSR